MDLASAASPNSGDRSKVRRLVQAAGRRRRIAMSYFVLEPEVAGWFGPATTGNLRVRPPQIEKFNYEFDTWLGDPLLEALSTFIVTDRLRERLIEAHASGVAFGDVEVTKAGIFLDLYGGGPLPAFSLAANHRSSGTDDFGLSSSRAFEDRRPTLHENTRG
jgi:hypothetical protein